jgi:hypothetical protein
MRRRGGALAAVLALGLLAAPPAEGHERSASYAVWRADAAGAKVALKLRARERDALRAAAATTAIEAGLPAWLGLGAGGRPCMAIDAARELAAAPGWARYEWRVACARPTEVHARGLVERIPGHVHLSRVMTGGGEQRVALAADAPAAALAAAGGAPSRGGAARFVALGFEHILGGVDHLMFLVALLVAVVRWRDAALAITGFTLGHSATLALVALGLVAPRQAPVEAVIGLSIALVAVDNLWLTGGRRDRLLPAVAIALCLAPMVMGAAVPALALVGLALFTACQLGLSARAHRPERVRVGVAALFGLVHGLAFAAGLRELTGEVGVRTLLGFNLGVELGQLAVVAVAWPALALARRELGTPLVTRVGSALALAAGVAWLAARA